MTDDHDMRDECRVLFGGIEKTLDAVRVDIQAQTKAGEDRHIQLMRTLHGYDDHPGFGGRIRTLEQDSARRRWWLRVIAGAMVVLAGRVIYLAIATAVTG